MAYGFNGDRSKAPVYTSAEIDDMELAQQADVEALDTATNQRIDETNGNLATQKNRIDTLVNTGSPTIEGRDVLWTGSKSTGDITLAVDVSDGAYDCLEVHYYFGSNVQQNKRIERVPVAGGHVDASFAIATDATSGSVGARYVSLLLDANDGTLLRLGTNAFASINVSSGTASASTSEDNITVTAVYGIKFASATEVTDIRVGYDGIVYPTAGDAVRKLLSAENTAIKGGCFLYTDVVWEDGAIESGVDAPGNYRRTVGYISTDVVDLVSNTCGAGIYILFYNYNSSTEEYEYISYRWIANNTLKYDTKTVTASHFRISAAKASSRPYPERDIRFFKHTADHDLLNAVNNRFYDGHLMPSYADSGAKVSWSTVSGVTTLDLSNLPSGDLNGYKMLDRVEYRYADTDDILAAAEASPNLTVSDKKISGGVIIIAVNIITKEVRAGNKTILPLREDERLFFGCYYNSIICGDVVEYEMMRRYQENLAKLNRLDEAVTSEIKVVPAYYKSHMETKVLDINANERDVGDHGDSFIFITDLHYPNNDGNSASLVDYVINHSSVSTVICGGDIVQGSTVSKSKFFEQLKAWHDAFRFCDSVFVRGNHDNNTEISGRPPELAVTDGELYAYTLKPIENKLVDRNGLHYCYDNNAQKIRYIILDTGHPDQNVISDDQITWMQGKVAELESGWTVVVITHQFYSTVGTKDGNGTKIEAGLDAVYDSSDAIIACVICGHSHADYDATSSKGYKIIATTCDIRGGEAGGLTRTAGSVTEQAFDVFSIDTLNRTIKTVRVGAGSSRSFTY